MIQSVSAADFLERWPRLWSQGEHVALIGPTGSGKTVWLEKVVEPRGHVVLMASKPRDPMIGKLRRKGWKVTREWPPVNDLAPRLIFWPKVVGLRQLTRQRNAFADMLDDTFIRGGRAVIADDLQYLVDTLGLKTVFRAYWIQARSMGVSLVAATQRPRWVPVECWANSSHFFLWQTANEDDLRQIGNIAGHDRASIVAALRALPRWHVLYVPAREIDRDPVIIDLRGIHT